MSDHHYYGFGEELIPRSGITMKFTGHERDGNQPGTTDDLDDMHARYYSPHLGRFLSVDPARGSASPNRPQSWNRYAYVMGNPVGYVDPDGKDLVLASDSKALREILVSALQRPTFRAAAIKIANDRKFTVTIGDARITSRARVSMAQRQGKPVAITFGTTAPVVRVVDGSTTRTGATVRIDTEMVRKQHPDHTGVVTAAHEIAGHAADFREGASAEMIEKTHGKVESLGYEVLSEAVDLTREDAEKLLDQIIVSPPE